jgi:hypothetical protein
VKWNHFKINAVSVRIADLAGSWTRDKAARRVKVPPAIATAGVCACMPETMVER